MSGCRLVREGLFSNCHTLYENQPTLDHGPKCTMHKYKTYRYYLGHLPLGRVLRHNCKSIIYKRKNWQSGPPPKQIPLRRWKDELTVQNMVNPGIWLQREGSAAALLVFTGVLFSNSWAHSEGWECLAATPPHPPGWLLRGQTPAPAHGHIPDRHL